MCSALLTYFDICKVCRFVNECLSFAFCRFSLYSVLAILCLCYHFVLNIVMERKKCISLDMLLDCGCSTLCIFSFRLACLFRHIRVISLLYNKFQIAHYSRIFIY
jgi:hypothetical protein